VAVNKRLLITVPAGTDTGQRVRLKGQGQRHPGGGAPGDLIITFQVQPDRFFRRDGLDVHVTVPLNLAQAVLGSKIKVRTLDGKRVVLRIPPGTQPGRKFRIKGQGMERNGRRGDQYVEVDVKIPQRLSDEEKKLLEQFAEQAELKY
jgi:molecular chaperone DnaJ